MVLDHFIGKSLSVTRLSTPVRGGEEEEGRCGEEGTVAKGRLFTSSCSSSTPPSPLRV